MKTELKVHEKPEGENPVYEIKQAGKKIYIQRITEIDNTSCWFQVKKINKMWHAGKFLGFSKQEAIKSITL